jgi:hypothetical protein
LVFVDLALVGVQLAVVVILFLVDILDLLVFLFQESLVVGNGFVVHLYLLLLFSQLLVVVSQLQLVVV